MRTYRKIKLNTLLYKAIIYRVISVLLLSIVFNYKVAVLAGVVSMIWYYIYDYLFNKYFRLDVKTEGKILWLTGLSGSGKTTISNELQKKLLKLGKRVQQIDGDILRKTVSKDLGFSLEDRTKNLERAIELANLLALNNVIAVCSFISPIRKLRDEFKQRFPDRFIEVYVYASLEKCEERDVKGLYKKARKGEIKNFTGISQPYEFPYRPDICVDTEKETVEESVDKILSYLKKERYI